MKRGSFLKQLAVLPFGSFFVKFFLQKEPGSRLLLNKFYVAGFQYYDGPSLIAQIAPGEELNLSAEDANGYDKFAVAVYHKETMLGYVPRTDNKHISRMLKQGLQLSCKVIESNPKRETWKMLRVEVSL